MSELLGEIRRARRDRRALLRRREDLCGDIAVAERELLNLSEFMSVTEYFGPQVRDQEAAINARARLIRERKQWTLRDQNVTDAHAALLAVEAAIKHALVREVAALRRWAIRRRQQPGDDIERRALSEVYRACYQAKFHARRILDDLAWHDPELPPAWRTTKFPQLSLQ